MSLSEVDRDEWDRERAAALRSANRKRAAEGAFVSEAPARQVVCMGCRAPVALSGFAWEFARAASEMLCSKGERPLGNDEMARCDGCAEAWKAERLGLFEQFCDKANKAQHEANAEGRINAELVRLLRFYGYSAWADGIESGANTFNSNQATKGRAHKERK